MPVNQAFLAELQHESASTKRMLERLPDENLLWSPHPKSMTLGRLSTHIAQLPIWFGRIIQTDEYNFAKAKPVSPEAGESKAAILLEFEKYYHQANGVLQNANDDNLNHLWQLKRGDELMAELPRKVMLRSLALNHLYHHRGQLSVYFRLLDIPVPGMYGPSADDKLAAL